MCSHKCAAITTLVVLLVLIGISLMCVPGKILFMQGLFCFLAGLCVPLIVCACELCMNSRTP